MLRFEISLKLLQNLLKLQSATALIENSIVPKVWKDEMLFNAQISNVVSSMSLEGITLLEVEVSRIVDSKAVDKPIMHMQSALNYYKALNFLTGKIQRNEDIYTLEVLKQTHELLMSHITTIEDPGVIRSKEITLKEEGGDVVLKPTKSVEIVKEVNTLFKFFQTHQSRELPAILTSAILHISFIRMQPFLEGSARLARVYSTCVLSPEIYSPMGFFHVFSWWRGREKDYLNSIVKHGSDIDLTNYLEAYVNDFIDESVKVKQNCEKKADQKTLMQRIGGLNLSARQEQLVLFIERNGKTVNGDWKRLFPDISQDTVLRDIKVLQKKRLIKKKGSTKAAFYVLRGM